MSLVTSRWTGDGIIRLVPALEKVGSHRAKRAMRMVINETGRAVYKEVKKELAKQVGVSQQTVVRRGAMIRRKATNENLEYKILAMGEYMPLADFRPTQFKKGVKASAWGNRKIYRSAFIVDKAGGHVFKNTGGWNRRSKRFNAIEKMFGPSIPNEMIKDMSRAAFFRVSRRNMQPRLEHVIRQMTKGVIS